MTLNVRDVEKSQEFYRKLLNIEPSKVRTGYAKFDVTNPPLNLTLNEVAFNGSGALSHLGMQGSWHIYRPGEAWQRPERQARVVVETGDFVAPCFNAPTVELRTARAMAADPQLAALGPDGYLINIARGSVVDEAALVDALVNRRIAGAGLDVFEHEPDVPASLCALDHVVLLPHVASGTRETRQAMVELTLANLRHFISYGTLLTAVA